MPAALTAVEALDNVGHKAAGRHRRNACRSMRTPSRACRHACQRSLRVRPRALPPAQSRAAPARGRQHHVLRRRASVARLLPRSHRMSRSRRTLTRTPNSNLTPALTQIAILTRTLIRTGSPATERSRPTPYLLTPLTRRTRQRRRWPAAALPLILPPWPAEARPRSTRSRQGGIISGQGRVISRGTRASSHSESGG